MFIMNNTEDMEYILYNHEEKSNASTRYRRAYIEEEMGVNHNEKRN